MVESELQLGFLQLLQHHTGTLLLCLKYQAGAYMMQLVFSGLRRIRSKNTFPKSINEKGVVQ